MSGYWDDKGRRTPADEALVRECDEWQRWVLDMREARMAERGKHLRLDDGECDEGVRRDKCA